MSRFIAKTSLHLFRTAILSILSARGSMFIDLKETVSDVAGGLLKGRDRLKVLEAGCGSSSHVRLPGTVHAVGIDISAEQLAKNTAVQEKILGDIQQYRLPRGEFDVTVCWMVLEHLSNPGDALLNLF